MASSSSSRSGKAGAGGFDHLFKILLVGDSGVGKSSILMRFTTEDCFDDMSPTIGVDFKLKMFDLEGKKLKVRNDAMISLRYVNPPPLTPFPAALSLFVLSRSLRYGTPLAKSGSEP